MTPLRRLLLLSTLLLSACQSRDGSQVASQTPEAATRQSIALIRAGDFDGFWRHALPPHDYAMLRDDWNRAHAARAAMTDDQRERVDTFLHQVAAPDAQATLDAQLQPWLARTQARYGDQLPLLVGIARALAASSINSYAGMSDEQKHDATALLDALVPWAAQAPWFDAGKARQAVEIVVTTTRELGLADAQSLHALDFDQAMHGYAVAFVGLKQVLALYGLPVEQALASAHVVPLDYHPPYARVRIEYRLLDRPLSLESTLVLQNGQWYDQDLIESVRKAHRQLISSLATDGGALPAAGALQ